MAPFSRHERGLLLRSAVHASAREISSARLYMQPHAGSWLCLTLVQAKVGLEKSQKKQRLLEARSTAATKRCEALEHRSKQQAAALEEARKKRMAAEASVVEADERCDALAGRLIAAEAAAADARDCAARVVQARDILYDEADASRAEAAALILEVRLVFCIPSRDSAFLHTCESRPPP